MLRTLQGQTTDDPAITVENGGISVKSGAFKSRSGLASLAGFYGVLLEDPLSPSGNFTETVGCLYGYRDAKGRAGPLLQQPPSCEQAVGISTSR